MSDETEFAALLATKQLAALGPGPREEIQDQASLNSRVRQLCSGSNLPVGTQELVRALILLWHDHLDAAHSIAQAIDNPDGAFVHGIMHRREPDYGNTTYWFRRVGKHGAYEPISRNVGEELSSAADADLRRQLLPHARWDPLAFINACERASTLPESDPVVTRLREIQRIEFESLLSWLLAAEPVR